VVHIATNGRDIVAAVQIDADLTGFTRDEPTAKVRRAISGLNAHINDAIARAVHPR
jgi:hypothetical protein